ncbi:YlbL family protein [Naasia lichenicola]|uniref:YlbL family protein n=1 Tax=Naasia lichenicola TaxID=2565933 RepID=UPI001E509A47|nr:PDZ domain-containing protein [Naasia lichenicola]
MSLLDLPSTDDLDAPRERRPLDTVSIGWVMVLVALVITLVLALLPSAYVIEQPGPVFDTLGVSNDDSGDAVPLIDIPSETTYDTTGSLDLLTVSIVGSPGSTPRLLDLALAWFDPSKSIQPLESIYPVGVSSTDRSEESRIQMENSQKEAVAAALTELGYDIPSTITVLAISDGTSAADVLEIDDQIVSVDGEDVANLSELRAALKEHGTGSPAEVGILRDGDPVTEEVTPFDSNGATVLGVGVAADYTFPFDVNIDLADVGGPSAGMMFALGIYDKLTPGSLTDGATIAGTGTIDGAGQVGAIGGIRQKLYGARDAGATIFLAPESNCDEVVGHIPAGLSVYAVGTLQDSIDVLDTLGDGGDASGLPTCTAG